MLGVQPIRVESDAEDEAFPLPFSPRRNVQQEIFHEPVRKKSRFYKRLNVFFVLVNKNYFYFRSTLIYGGVFTTKFPL